MKVLFGAIVSVVLLGVYVYLVARGLGALSCSNEPCAIFNERMASSLSLIGGLISALVIAELSVTQKGELPVTRLLAPSFRPTAVRATKVVIALYLFVWLGTGLVVFVAGYLQPESIELQSMADLGQTWLGIAVGAGYAYFGIAQPRQTQ